MVKLQIKLLVVAGWIMASPHDCFARHTYVSAPFPGKETLIKTVIRLKTSPTIKHRIRAPVGLVPDDLPYAAQQQRNIWFMWFYFGFFVLMGSIGCFTGVFCHFWMSLMQPLLSEFYRNYFGCWLHHVPPPRLFSLCAKHKLVGVYFFLATYIVPFLIPVFCCILKEQIHDFIVTQKTINSESEEKRREQLF